MAKHEQRAAVAKFRCVGLLVLCMGFLPLASAYWQPLAVWLLLLEPVLCLMALWLFNRGMDQYLRSIKGAR